MRITEPGIYKMEAYLYHKDPVIPAPSLSNSIARKFITESELHAFHAHPRLNPEYKHEEAKKFDLGSAAHALVLEGDNRMMRIPYDNYLTKPAKEMRDSARAAGMHPVLTEDFDNIFLMREAFLRSWAECEELRGIPFSAGAVEETLVWREGDTWLRIRPDWRAQDWSIMVDYKTAHDAVPRVFGRAMVSNGYHHQDSFYSRGVKASFGKRPLFLFGAQDTAKPFAVSWHGCAPTLQDVADGDIEMAVRRWANCLKTGIWRGYGNRVHWHEATSWQLTESEERAVSQRQDGDAYGRAMSIKESDPV